MRCSRSPLYLSYFTATSCLGAGLQATREALLSRRSALAPCNFDGAQLATWTGMVEGVERQVLPAHLCDYDCRNNRLAQLGLEQDGFAQAVRSLASRLGAGRIGVFLGTSTSGIYETERAYRQRDPATGALPAGLVYSGSHNPYSLTGFVRAYLGLDGPATSISSACSSSGKVFASAWRMIDAGLIDAAVVGGVDSLCLTTLYGFGSLAVLSDEPCRPFDAARHGISIGEGAAFALLERPPARLPADAILLLGVGESSDAHHMSAPHPEGLGAKMAMQQAMDMAGVTPREVGYINLHGTATPANDAAEGLAVAALFGAGVPCSSTKGATGHALGAAGGLEAVISALALREGVAWAGANTAALDPAIASIDYLLENRPAVFDMALSNSFGFGGTNSSVLLGRASAERMVRGSAAPAVELDVWVGGVGLLGPGFDSWQEARAMLTGAAAVRTDKTRLPVPVSLPAAERRRAGLAVKAALAVGWEALEAAGVPAAELACVFASSGGDGVNCHEMCSALATADRVISPTRFHNSVHNAVAGYWSISSHAMATSSVLCAFDGSFAAGLLEAMAQAVVEDRPVLLLAYDTDYPQPLFALRDVPDTMGVALLLSPRPGPHDVGRITVAPDAAYTTAPARTMDEPALERIRLAIPAARSFPLLRALALGVADTVVVDYLDGLQLSVRTQPC